MYYREKKRQAGLYPVLGEFASVSFDHKIFTGSFFQQKNIDKKTSGQTSKEKKTIFP